ncbi:MAG: hypothetical protein ABIJ97_11490 [Bacteroidota bacterium]
MALKINLSEIRALSKEQRQEFALVIRQQPELFNAVNGVGGLPENANYGLLQGITSDQTGPVANAVVEAIGDLGTKTAKSNQYGFYQLGMVEGIYRVTFKLGEEISDPKEFEVRNGISATADYQFK